MTTPTHVLWLDLETTQTDPDHPYAALLELGAIITTHDPELTEVGRASMLFRPLGGPSDHAMTWAAMDPFVQAMHTDNGLWAEATMGDQAWDLVHGDAAVARWVRSVCGDAPVPLAGSGVAHLDHPWVRRHLPHLAQRLTYWMMDVGQVRRLLALAGRDDLVDMAGDVEAKPHRGLGDVELHVAEARRYLKLLGQMPMSDGSPWTGQAGSASTPVP